MSFGGVAHIACESCVTSTRVGPKAPIAIHISIRYLMRICYVLDWFLCSGCAANRNLDVVFSLGT